MHRVPESSKRVEVRGFSGNPVFHDIGQLKLQQIRSRISGFPPIAQAFVIIIEQMGTHGRVVEQQRTMGDQQSDGVLHWVNVWYEVVLSHKVQDVPNVLWGCPGCERHP